MAFAGGEEVSHAAVIITASRDLNSCVIRLGLIDSGFTWRQFLKAKHAQGLELECTSEVKTICSGECHSGAERAYRLLSLWL